MKEFKNILVGVDLSEGDRLVGHQLGAATRQAFDCAVWLAKVNDAKLTILSTIDVEDNVQAVIEQDATSPNSLLQAVRQAHEALKADAAAQGVQAEVATAFGRSWMQLIRQVMSAGHDLVIVGSREHGGLHNMLLGSTGSRLLRKCPCPVWVTRPHNGQELKRILVAHDLTDVGRRCLTLGAEMAEMCDAELHVLHAVEPPNMDEALAMAGVPEQFESDADDASTELDKEVARLNLPAERIHAVTVRREPSSAILEHCEQHHIDLLLMGTIARSGIPGFLMGNTAERLLPRVPCSLVAIKPDDFVCPVALK